MRFPVGADTQAALEERLLSLGVREQDLVERFIRSSGPGGQNVNKTSTAVYLKHLPSGIEIKAQTTRSQGQNRFLARRRLAEALEAKREGQKSVAQQRAYKQKKQKARRSRRAKEKVLAAKHVQSDKKRARQVRGDRDE